ncbi:MAG TPA: SDR family oxidoreductase, partial [Ilumatobacter sp.]|nr:SDR family oxidoreductase [Ilumatobacter sp.]
YCQAAAAEGARVVAGDVSACDATVDEIVGAGGDAIGVHLDVGDAASCELAVHAAVERFGGLDGLVNNAALYAGLHSGPFERIDPDEWEATMRVNVTGVYQMCRAAVGPMRERDTASIVNISSLAAVYGLPNALHYTTSKAAVLGITRGLARELGRYWIRVNAVAPSAVLTEGTDAFFAGGRDRALDVIATGQALRRNLEPADVAGTVIHLLSDESRFVTAQTLMVDGGTVAT